MLHHWFAVSGSRYNFDFDSAFSRAHRVAATAADTVARFHPSGRFTRLHGLVKASFEAPTAVGAKFRIHLGLFVGHFRVG
jgi:hypothetical protein